MKFDKKVLQELALGFAPVGYKLVSDIIIDHRRWSVTHELVFEFEGKTYGTSYSIAATELQEEGPFDYDPQEIECATYEPYTKTLYRKKP